MSMVQTTVCIHFESFERFYLQCRLLDQEMRVESEKLENEFWHDLEKFRAKLSHVFGMP